MFEPTPTPEELANKRIAVKAILSGCPISQITEQYGIRRTLLFQWRAESYALRKHPINLKEKGYCPECRCTVYLPCMACEIKAAIAEGYSGAPQFTNDRAKVKIGLDFSDFPPPGAEDEPDPEPDPKGIARRYAEIFKQPSRFRSATTSSRVVHPKASDPNAADTSEERDRLFRLMEEREGITREEREKRDRIAKLLRRSRKWQQ